MGVRIYKRPGVRSRRTSYSVAMRLHRGGLRGLEPGDIVFMRDKKNAEAVIRRLNSSTAFALADLLGMPRPEPSELRPVGSGGMLEKLQSIRRHDGKEPRLQRLSLYPLTLEQAISAFMKVDPASLAPRRVKVLRRLSKYRE